LIAESAAQFEWMSASSKIFISRQPSSGIRLGNVRGRE
jgi:hypothetical protein